MPASTPVFYLVLSPGARPAPEIARDLTRRLTDRKCYSICTLSNTGVVRLEEDRRSVKAPSVRSVAARCNRNSVLPNFRMRLQGTVARCSTGASAPPPGKNGDYQEKRSSNSNTDSGWQKRFQSDIGSGASSRAGGPHAGAIGDGCGGSPGAESICSPGATSNE
jgi:hypothetical protein